METQQTEQSNELVKYDITEKELSRMLEEASKIKVIDWQDETNYLSAKEAYKIARSLFNKVEKRREELKRPILDAGKKLDAEANKIKKRITEITDILQKQLDVVELELKRQEQEAEAEKQQIINERVQELQSYGADTQIYLLDPEFCNEEKYSKILSEARDKFSREEAKKKILAPSLENTDKKQQRIIHYIESLSLEQACTMIVELEDKLSAVIGLD